MFDKQMFQERIFEIRKERTVSLLLFLFLFSSISLEFALSPVICYTFYESGGLCIRRPFQFPG